MTEKSELITEQEKPWAATERVRPPWVKREVKYAKTIPPQMDQKSNIDLRDSEVMSPRTEPVDKSFAPPISGSETNAPTEFSPTARL